MEPGREGPAAPGWGCGGSAELVYHLAGALGTELQELARRCGPEAAAGLVPLVVRALELLEKAAVGPVPDAVSGRLAPRPAPPRPCGRARQPPSERAVALPSCRCRRSGPKRNCGACGRRTGSCGRSCARRLRVSGGPAGPGRLLGGREAGPP